MLRKLTFLACIVFVGNLNAERVPIPVPQAIQNAYAVSDIKHGHFDDPRGRNWVVDNGVLYAMNTNLYARTQPPLVNNVVRNGTLLPYHARVADNIFGIPRGKKIKQGELFYLSNIAAEENGLVFTFESWNLYPESFVTADGTAINSERSARMKIRFAVTPAQIATLTPEAMKQMTEKLFTVSSTSVHAPIITPDYEW